MEEKLNEIKELQMGIKRLEKEYKIYSKHSEEASEPIKYSIDKNKWKIEELLKPIKEDIEKKEKEKNNKIEKITKESEEKLKRLEKEYEIYSKHSEEASEPIKYNMDKIKWELEKNIKNINEEYEEEKNNILNKIQETGINVEEYGLIEKENEVNKDNQEKENNSNAEKIEKVQKKDSLNIETEKQEKVDISNEELEKISHNIENFVLVDKVKELEEDKNNQEKENNSNDQNIENVEEVDEQNIESEKTPKNTKESKIEEVLDEKESSTQIINPIMATTKTKNTTEEKISNESVKVIYSAKYDNYIIRNMDIKEDKIIKRKDINEVNKETLAQKLETEVELLNKIDINLLYILSNYDEQYNTKKAKQYFETITDKNKNKEDIKNEMNKNKIQIEYNLKGLYDEKVERLTKEEQREILNVANNAKKNGIATVKKGPKVVMRELVDKIIRKTEKIKLLPSKDKLTLPQTKREKKKQEEYDKLVNKEYMQSLDKDYEKAVKEENKVRNFKKAIEVKNKITNKAKTIKLGKSTINKDER